MARELRSFVERSLAALECEAPRFHRQLCATLRGRRLLISGDSEPFTLDFGGDGCASLAPDRSEDVSLAVDRGTILALVDGEITLEEALRQDRLQVHGPLKHVADLFESLVIFVRGGIRCPALPGLLSEFRGSTPHSVLEVSR